MVLLLNCVPIASFNASASTNGYTRESAAAWMLDKVLGHGWNVDGGGVGYDCKDLALKYFADVGGLYTQELGNAYIYAEYATLPDGWTRQYYSDGYIPQKGDMACWSTDYYYAGHVALIYDVDDTYIYVVEQSSNKNVPAYKSKYSINSPKCFVVPDFIVFTEPPTSPTVSVDQSIAMVNDDITISFSAERVQRYWIGIYKDNVLFNDYSVYNGNSITLDYPWVGKYDVVVVAVNNCGDASGYASFYVGNEGDYEPENFTVSCSKQSVMKNESVTVSFSADYTTAYWVGIYHNDEWVLRDNYTSNSITVKYADPGEYSVAIVAMNPCSSSETKYVKFTVLDVQNPPTKPTVKVNKSVNLINDPIIISFDSNGADDYWVGIYKDDVLFNDYVTTDKQITVDYPWVGKYDIAVVARNSYGSTGGYASFYVGNEGDYMPQNFTLTGNKKYAIKNEAVKVTFNADYATDYWIGVYHNGQWLGTDAVTGHTFTMWYSDLGEYSVAVVARNACSSTDAKYYKFTVVEQKTFTLQYDPNGGYGAPHPSSKEYNQSINLSTTIPEKAGYSFLRWNTKKDGSGTNYTAGSVYSVNANLMLYAQWTADAYTVTLDPDGGACGIPAITVFTGEKYGVLPVAVREGYTFDGWYLPDGTQITEDSPVMILENHTLRAHWTKNYVAPTIAAASTAVLDDERAFLYGLDFGMTEETLRSEYLSVNGDGHLEIVTNGAIGTGTLIRLINDQTGSVDAEYTVIIFGDVNGDGMLTTSDITALRNINARISDYTPDSANYFAADVTHDGVVNLTDITEIRSVNAQLHTLRQSI